MFKFRINKTGKINLGSVIYRKEENSFDFIPCRNADITILIGYLHIAVDSETMAAQQVWGMVPFEGWDRKKLTVPSFAEGELLLEGDLQPGMTYKINGSETWVAKFDSQSGWFCIGDCEINENDTAIKFANSTIAVIGEGLLKALWLKPILE